MSVLTEPFASDDIIVAPDKSANTHDIAQLLSRIAALNGVAVPTFRFEMLEYGRNGAQVHFLDAQGQAIEMWLACFSTGSVTQIPVQKIKRGDFPLFWVADTPDQPPLILKGAKSNGVYTAEDVLGNQIFLPPDQALEGACLRLITSPLVDQQDQTPKTAKQWFRFAVAQHRGVFLEAIFASFITSALGLFIALYTMQVYDRVVPTRGYSTLWVLTIGVVLAIGFEYMMKQARSRIVDIASKKIDLELSSVFFGKAMDIRMDARPPTVGTFASQIRHFESVRDFMTSSTLFILADAPFAVLFIAVMAIIGGPVALVPLVMMPLAVVSSFFFLRKVRQISAENMKESNQKNGLLIEAIDGVESVKACGGEWKVQDRYRHLTATISHSDLKMRTMQARAANMGQVIHNLNYIGMIAVGAFAITQGIITMGALIACSIIAGRALSPISQIPSLVMRWNQASIALDSLDNIMAMPSDRDCNNRLIVPNKCQGDLLLKNVSFNFIKEKAALNVDELHIKPGERVGIIGPVGSGKSTLIKLLSGLYCPSDGAVLLDDVDMQQLAPQYVREHIGYLPQDVRLFSGTLRDNLTLGLPTPSDSRLLKACQLTGLQNIIIAHPQGLELPITEGGRGLSGGQRQLVGLTRLLLAQPKIMLLDEPTAAMDGQLEASVMAHLFEEIASSTTLIVVTHKPNILRHVDRLLVVENGRVMLNGPRDNVLQMLKPKITSQ